MAEPQDKTQSAAPPLEERKKMAKDAIKKGILTLDDISQTYSLPIRTVVGMKGYMMSQGILPKAEENGKEEKAVGYEPGEETEVIPTPVIPTRVGGSIRQVRAGGKRPQTGGYEASQDPRDAQIEQLTNAVAEMKEKFNSSGRIIPRTSEELDDVGDGIMDAFQRNQEMIAVPIVQKVITNAKNTMFFDYMKSDQGFKGDFGDLVNDALEFMMKSFRIKIKIEREVA